MRASCQQLTSRGTNQGQTSKRENKQANMDSESGDLSEDLSPVGGESFNARKLALQAQKKILSKMATKTVASLLIDETSSDILDELYHVTREYTGDKKEAHRVLKDLIKVALKIGILYRNSQFNQEEGETADRFKKKLNQAAMTAVSFYEVEFTFDTQVLAVLLNECRDLLHRLVERHLTLKSHGRIDRVFRLFASSDFLCTLYNPRGVHRSNLQKICAGVNKLLDERVL